MNLTKYQKLPIYLACIFSLSEASYLLSGMTGTSIPEVLRVLTYINLILGAAILVGILSRSSLRQPLYYSMIYYLLSIIYTLYSKIRLMIQLGPYLKNSLVGILATSGFTLITSGLLLYFSYQILKEQNETL